MASLRKHGDWRPGSLFLLALLGMTSGCATVRTITEAPKAILTPSYKVTLWPARCADGVELCLRRYQNKNSNAKPEAVILCHGIGANGNMFDLPGQRGLAVELVGAGCDVWVPDLRGCGLSGNTAPGAGMSAWSVDDYVRQDVPAILAEVRRASGAKKVVWVGHNLGACIALIHAAAHPEDKGIAIVSVGASMEAASPFAPVLADEEARERLIRPPLRFSYVAGEGAVRVPKGWDALFFNPAHVPSETVALMARQAGEPASPRVAEQFLAMLRGGQLRSADGKVDYAGEMGRVKCPTLFLCGKADNLAEPGLVRRLYQTVSSEDKTFRLFCLTNGDGADFGNADLLVGPRAPIDVFPTIVKWVEKRR